MDLRLSCNVSCANCSQDNRQSKDCFRIHRSPRVTLVAARATTNAKKRSEKSRNKRAVDTSHRQAGQRRSGWPAIDAGGVSGAIAGNGRFFRKPILDLSFVHSVKCVGLKHRATQSGLLVPFKVVQQLTRRVLVGVLPVLFHKRIVRPVRGPVSNSRCSARTRGPSRRRRSRLVH